MSQDHSIPDTMKRSILKSLRAWARPDFETVHPADLGRQRLSGKAIRIPLDDHTVFRIEMGKQLAQLCPDPGVTGQAWDSSRDFILFDPDRFRSGITQFLRVSPGQTLSIDRNSAWQEYVFSHPREAFRRHLSITHAGDALLFRDPISELGTWVSLHDDSAETISIGTRRNAAAQRILELFGGPLRPLPRQQAIERLEKVNDLLGRENAQQSDSMGNPGGLVKLPGHVTPVIVGDLHARLDNLLKILCENAFLEGLEQDTAALVILGDAVHREPPGDLEEMDSSLLMMDLVFSLKLRYPNRVFYLIGNHDSFQHDLMKRGIPQGLLWDKHIVAARGEEYREQLEMFYRQSPLLVLSADFIACHAGPPRRAITRQTLVDVHQFPAIVHDMTWGRLKTAAFPGGYTRSNVKQLRKGLQVDRELPFIVGHHPYTQDDTLWLNVGQTRQHHIVISSRSDRIGLFTRIDGDIVPQLYPAEPVLEWLNSQVAVRSEPVS